MTVVTVPADDDDALVLVPVLVVSSTALGLRASRFHTSHTSVHDMPHRMPVAAINTQKRTMTASPSAGLPISSPQKFEPAG